MVELGFIDAETLTVYLGLELGMPIATGATLERCKRSAVRLLSPQQAARFRCVPIVIQGQTLIIAIDDPHDIESLDALHSITGYRILPRVAPEIRIYYYLERFYGVARPNRYRALGESPRGSSTAGSHAAANLPGPPLPGLPPRRATPVAAPTPRPVVRRSGMMSAQPPPAEAFPSPSASAAAPAPAAAGAQAAAQPAASAAQPAAPLSPSAGPIAAGHTSAMSPAPAPAAAAARQHEALELEANDLVIELEADEAEVAGHVTSPVAASAELSARHRAPRTTAPIYAVHTLEEALAAMERTDQRGSVADAVLGFAAGLFEVAALCVVRDQFAFGWKGFGPGLDADRLETLMVPLEIRSIFHLAFRSKELFRGHASGAPLHDHIFKVLRCHTSLYSIVAPISIGQRVVNLLYGHKANGADITDKEHVAVRRITAAAGEAYVRLISESKAQRRGGNGAPTRSRR